ncbi:hypothetical protein LJY25_14650 [Hymenobacter sp. BT175]|uniref:hypothetical protein n=1 Tax=Hymenobacter translucens TaxID=2886507 RepID=UPI001D0E18E6|nr:hypothetical protein [Hymenobacter translucens]MCC2547692.1 hypothetical protein [Hymenobacter translucens]
MPYDAQKLSELEGEAQAATARLAKVLPPVQQQVQDAFEAFDLLNTKPGEGKRWGEVATLLATMQAYFEATAAYNAQLRENLAQTEEAAHHESVRAAFFKHQWNLCEADLRRSHADNAQQYAFFQEILERKGGAAA